MEGNQTGRTIKRYGKTNNRSNTLYFNGIGIAGCAPQSEPVQTAQAAGLCRDKHSNGNVPTPAPAATPYARARRHPAAGAQAPTPTPEPTLRTYAEKLLSGIVIGIDPGHQAKGNRKRGLCAGGRRDEGKAYLRVDGRNTGTPEYKITLAVGPRPRIFSRKRRAGCYDA